MIKIYEFLQRITEIVGGLTILWCLHVSWERKKTKDKLISV